MQLVTLGTGILYAAGIFYAVVRQMSMLFIDNKISVFCMTWHIYRPVPLTLQVYHCKGGELSQQKSTYHVSDGAFLAVLGDPVVCFADASFKQTQVGCCLSHKTENSSSAYWSIIFFSFYQPITSNVFVECMCVCVWWNERILIPL